MPPKQCSLSWDLSHVFVRPNLCSQFLKHKIFHYKEVLFLLSCFATIISHLSLSLQTTTTMNILSNENEQAKEISDRPIFIDPTTAFAAKKTVTQIKKGVPPVSKNVDITPPPVPEEFLCQLTFTVMDDPLMTKSGLNFERSAIVGWLEKKNVCPVTWEPLIPSMLVPNVPLRIRIQQWNKAVEMMKEDLGCDESRRNKDLSTGKMTQEEQKNLESLPPSVPEDDNSWCWDADYDLGFSAAKLPNHVDDNIHSSSPPRNIVVTSMAGKSDNEEEEEEEEEDWWQTILVSRMAMESSTKDTSRDISPKVAIRKTTKQNFKAARSA